MSTLCKAAIDRRSPHTKGLDLPTLESNIALREGLKAFPLTKCTLS